MLRFRELWQRLPERLRNYAVRVALRLVLVAAAVFHPINSRLIIRHDLDTTFSIRQRQYW